MGFPENAVFVYGTLKPGGKYWPVFCEGKTTSVTPAKIRGRLYDLHVGYPGLRRDEDGWVHGFVLVVPDPADFRRIDELEGYSPDQPVELNEYIRLKTPCFDTASGEELGSVWAYEVTPETLAQLGGTPIPSGNWPIPEPE